MQWIAEQMQSLMPAEAPSQPPKLKQGALCLAVFSQDKQLYRCVLRILLYAVLVDLLCKVYAPTCAQLRNLAPVDGNVREFELELALLPLLGLAMETFTSYNCCRLFLLSSSSSPLGLMTTKTSATSCHICSRGHKDLEGRFTPTLHVGLPHPPLLPLSSTLLHLLLDLGCSITSLGPPPPHPILPPNPSSYPMHKLPRGGFAGREWSLPTTQTPSAQYTTCCS